MIKTPSFWYSHQPTWQEITLLPFSMIYAALVRLNRSMKKSGNADIPVICVGNLNAGGSGKTPLALVLMQIVKEHGGYKNPYFLSRGYGGRIMGPTVFDPRRHSFEDVGDEVLLLGKFAPCIVAKDRLAGARLAASRGADILIMDDGLQNYGLKQDLKIVVIDGSMGFGNKRVIPAGPLRENLQDGLAKADMFVVFGEDKRGIGALLPKNIPILKAQLRARVTEEILGKDFIAFSGLGWPQKFFASLRALGLNIVESVPFPDHHVYTAQEMDDLFKRAMNKNARLITTRKDIVRVPSFYAKDKKIAVAGVHVEWNDPENAIGIIQGFLSSLGKRS